MLDVAHADRIPEPGAKISKHVPKFENEERASVVVVEPTVIALAARAGEKLQAFALLLPAATAIVTPLRSRRLFTAVSSALEAPPPRLMFATAGAMWFRRTQSTPAITPEFEPEPEQLSTRTPRQQRTLCHAESRTADGSGDVSAVTVAILTVAAKGVKHVRRTSAKLSVRGANTGVDHTRERRSRSS